MEIDGEEASSSSKRAPEKPLNLTIRIPYTENVHSTTATPSTVISDVIASIPTALTPPPHGDSSSAPNRLIFQGQILDSAHTLAHYNIPDNGVLHLIPPPPQRPPASPRTSDAPDHQPANRGFQQHFHHSFVMGGVNFGSNGIGYDATSDILAALLESLYVPRDIARHAAIVAATIVTTSPASAYHIAREFVGLIPGNNVTSLPDGVPDTMASAFRQLVPHVGASLVELGTALMAGEDLSTQLSSRMTRASNTPFVLQMASSTLSALGVMALATALSAGDRSQEEQEENGESMEVWNPSDGGSEGRNEEREGLDEDELHDLFEEVVGSGAQEDTRGLRDRPMTEEDKMLTELLDQFDKEEEHRKAPQGIQRPCSFKTPAAHDAHGSTFGASSSSSARRLGLAAGLRAGPASRTRSTHVEDELSKVLSMSEALKWRRILASDSCKLAGYQPRPVSRGYRGLNDQLPSLSAGTAKECSAQLMRDVVNSPEVKRIGITVEGATQLVDAANTIEIGALYEKELDAAISGRLVGDPDYDPSQYPNAEKRFGGN